MVLPGLKRCLPESMRISDQQFCFSDHKKPRNNDVLPGELDRYVASSDFETFLARNPRESEFPECNSESGSERCPTQEYAIPERVEVVCNETEGLYFPGLHMVQCGCKNCKIMKNNPKRSVGDWEKHAGSRAKKWKVSIKLKATKQPLGEWVSGYSAPATPGLNPTRLSAFLSQSYTPIPQKWTPERCAICRWNEDWEYDKIVICNRCEMAVHQQCYGVTHIQDFTNWICNSCHNSSTLNPPECCLCPVKGGALKPCDVQPFWVHVICAWFRPEMHFQTDKMEPAVGLMRVPPKSFLQSCQICNQTHGACVQCCKCSNVYHSTCAFSSGFYMEMVLISHKNGSSTSRLILYCDSHKPPNSDSKLEIRTRNPSPKALKSSESGTETLESSESGTKGTSVPDSNEPELEPKTGTETKPGIGNEDQFSAARCRAYERTTPGKRREKLEGSVINARLNYENVPENIHQGFMSMTERMKYLQRTMKERICLGKSGIHGWGAFARRKIREGEAVGEYVGEVVRRSVADVREARYKAKGRDCYLFGINGEFVIDATMKGSLTRLVNHSCMPNCYSRIVNLGEGNYGIVIIAKRDVRAGEELTLDYMFDHSQDCKPCLCGAPNCRKFI